MTPNPQLIDSMAFRYRHDFGLLDEQTKDSIRTTMRQLWEEVVGIGFYKEQKQELPKQNDVREDNVEKLAEEFKNQYSKVGVTEEEVSAFILGYNKAKENTYTEEQVREAIQKARHSYATSFDIIQSLKQPK